MVRCFYEGVRQDARCGAWKLPSFAGGRCSLRIRVAKASLKDIRRRTKNRCDIRGVSEGGFCGHEHNSLPLAADRIGISPHYLTARSRSKIGSTEGRA